MSLLQSLLAEIGFLNYDSGLHLCNISICYISLKAISKTTGDFGPKSKKKSNNKIIDIAIGRRVKHIGID